MMLIVKNLSKKFRRPTGEIFSALREISFSLEEGESLGIVGESGSGKSTLAHALLRLIEPDSGSVFFEGRELLTLLPRELRGLRKEMQLIFQDPLASLNPRKTILENIGEPLLVHRRAHSKAECRALVAEALSCVGLSSAPLERFPHAFSGGQQQRLAIARAIALRPRLLVCDEALSALDLITQSEMVALLQELQRTFGLTYLFISHQLSLVRRLCTRILVLYQGEIVEAGATEALFSNAQHPYTRHLLEAIPQRGRRYRRGEHGEGAYQAGKPSYTEDVGRGEEDQ